MTPERWRRIKEVLAAAVALQTSDRASYLTAACADDAELRREVESLLASHELAASGFLETPALALDAPADRPNGSASGAGCRIGAYQIVRSLGSGGMADVFEAVRADGQYEKRVALKLVRAGYGSAGMLERFRAERQILAGLDHPNVARLLDGGTTGSGVPYLVMELVEGVPIDEFCRTRELSTAGRLRLFLQVCSAVQYAHQRLVIHRDLKPANILVAGDGVPKLLDFGIAKLLDPVGIADETMLRPFTPEYASPEQIRGEPVSTASDVYALGVVLYQLLTGRSPYRLETRSPGHLADAITSQEPERPSTAAVRGGTLADPTTATLQRRLRGDLDAIVLKALRKEPDKRYPTVEQVADDIRRHLDGLPVAARKGTWSYHAAKFARRHRAAVAAAVLVLLTLVAGIVVTAREARIAQANQRRADARFNDVRKLANSLIFEIHDSIQRLPGALDARKLILQRALDYLDSLAKESANEPDLVRELAAAYDRIGELQGNPFTMHVGDTKAAQASFLKSVAMRESLARSNPRNVQDQVELARVYLDYAEFESGAAGDVRAGFDDAKRALAILDREARAAPDDPHVATLTMNALSTLGMLQEGTGLSATVGTPRQGVADLQRALRLVEHAIERAPSDVSLRYRQAQIEAIVGESLLKLGDRQEALAHYERSRDLFDPLLRNGDDVNAAFNRAVVLGKIGDVLLIDGKAAQAVPFYAEDEQAASRLAAADPHNESAQRQETIALVELGHAMVESDRSDEGMHYIRQAVARVDANGSDAPWSRAIEALIRGWFGAALERQGNTREAAREYSLVKEHLGAVLARGIDDPRMQGYLAAAADRLGAVLVKLGEIDRAAREYEEARTRLEPLASAHPDDLEIAYVLAETYTAEGNMAAARAGRARAPADKLAEWQAAARWHRKSLDVWRTVPHPGRTSTSGFDVTLPAEVSNRLARCEREVKSLGVTGAAR